MRKLILILFFNSILFNISIAQSVQGWAIYFGNTQIKESKFSIHHELQLRDYKLLGDHNQTLVRVGGQYQFSSLVQGTLGYAFVHSEAEGTPNNSFSEHRVYQEAVVSHGVKSSKIRHRFRLEERFIEGQDFRGRVRYCLFADVPLSNKQFDKHGTYLAFYDELFVNLSSDRSIKAFDRNRAYAGLGYKFKKNLGAQVGYMRQNVGSNNGTNHLLLSVHHKMNWR
ncbi:DUF2490 domain-containing protein [Sphingobacterium bovistauri]|uniref:DUF2490 domain-containing protein n=1 Tax=Sphingobacterium bovistauri TaxID=2781959 RepID=A0ABS7Z9Z4_9SPHI|nr:DUF2490 domain-containing protein [Sphingobacterium bovistauri]MCA5006828.1 DUF2490 domain-containing protein [Sphingobacterium bovistauri]